MMTVTDATATPTTGFDPGHFRQVLGQYPTGVVVVTAMSESGEALGMTVGSFTSVSIDPPMVAFLPDKASSSWAALRASGGHFCVNVLGSDQEDVCRMVATRKRDKFDGIPWHPSPAGLPLIDGAVAYMDCLTEVVHDAGDHHIVLGRVLSLDIVNHASYPLLFFRGGYGSFLPLSLAAGDGDLVEHLRLVDIVRGGMEELARAFGTEVTAITRIRDEVVLTATAGTSSTAVTPTRVGQRLPFLPPVGSVFAAFGSDQVRNAWLTGLGPDAPRAIVDYYSHVPERIRAQGYSIALGHERSRHVERISNRINVGDPAVDPRDLRSVVRDMDDMFNPTDLDPTGRYELHLLSAPVFRVDGEVAFTLNLWGPRHLVPVSEIERYAKELKKTAHAATVAIGGRPPQDPSTD
jgi:flavin reductase (DIM6/NTAB) family NADH-FMN oxidoreductase RutF/DNA-binding IclR family transcriptional regulator